MCYNWFLIVLLCEANISVYEKVIIINKTVIIAVSGVTASGKTTRYEIIEVEYFDRNFKKHKEKFSGFTAQIIQHEVDHFEGIII